MTQFKQKYRVESSRLKDWNYANVGWYFVTLCTRNLECFFGDVVNGKMYPSAIGKIVAEEWQKTERIRSNVELDQWIIMPNHLHGIIVIKNIVVETSRRGVVVETSRRDVSIRRDVSTPRLKPNSLGSIIGQFKSVCTKRIWAAGFHSFAWQPRFYDHMIRDEKSLNDIREYIINNPAKWELDKNNPENLYI